MISNSACDGVMEFNSDFLDNGGVQGDFGVVYVLRYVPERLFLPILQALQILKVYLLSLHKLTDNFKAVILLW
ncbi:MAG: hypothetical protein IPO92_03365 [Saprospiraceae bacterium]|nr:hypothetical protein [Saprospiraceae bacterium]